MLNGDSVLACRLASKHWEGALKALIEEHVRRTGSPRAAQLLSRWAQARAKFWQICPKEMLQRLVHPLSDAVAAPPVAVA
jgi:glutamate synthase (NADPH/NADH) large chain